MRKTGCLKEHGRSRVLKSGVRLENFESREIKGFRSFRSLEIKGRVQKLKKQKPKLKRGLYSGRRRTEECGWCVYVDPGMILMKNGGH